jgi:predicted ribosomally synthesized peptide with nif11-like leader
MSNIQKFLDTVKENKELQKKVNGKSDADIVAAAKAAGFVITAEELRASAKKSAKEMTDESLASVAGGRSVEMDGGFVAWGCPHCNALNFSMGAPMNFRCAVCGASYL